MVNYSDSKVVSIGKLDDLLQPDNIFVTTLKPSQFLADLRKKYRNYMKAKMDSNIAIFDIITKVGLENITIKVLKQVALKNKQELNDLLLTTKNEYLLPIDLLISKNKTLISGTTVAIYEANLKIVMRKLEIDNVKYFYENPDDVISRIDNLPISLETKKNYFKSISAIIPVNNPLKKVYGSHITQLSSKVEVIQNEQLKNPDIIYKSALTLNKITMELVKKGNLQDAVISLFYSGFYLPVFRIKEVISLKWKNYNVVKDNYISFGTDEFILNDYKTVKVYGNQKVKFPKNVKDLMLKLISSIEDKDNDYLLIKNNKQPYNESEFSLKVSNIFGTNVNNLRSMYITAKFNDGLINTETDKIKLATEMRNSPSVFKTYIKFDENKQQIKFI
jgi:hypothetical protein